MGGCVQLMATTGNYITASELNKRDVVMPSWTKDNDLTPNGGTSYLYIACWNWSFKFVGNYAFFGSPTHTLRVQYWDNTASAWTTIASKSVKNTTWLFDVNSSSGTTVYKYPTWIWRISFSNSSGYYKGAGKGYLYLCGIGDAGNYADDVVGEYICCLGDSQYWVSKQPGATSGNGQNLTPSEVAIYNTRSQRGNPILASTRQSKFVPKIGSY